MSKFSEIIASLRGEINARNHDPILGTFILAWITCNWDKVAKLIWGESQTDIRIQEMVASLSLCNFFSDLRLFIVPALLTAFFLLGFPWVSLWVKNLQLNAIRKQHTHSVDLDLSKIVELKKLRKESLRADPTKEFLAREVNLDLEKEAQRNERRNRIKQYIDSKADAAKAEAESRKLEAEAKQLEVEKKESDAKISENERIRSERQTEIENLRFETESALQREIAASARFPVLFQIIYRLSEALSEDSIKLSISGLARITSALWGYSNVEKMIEDKKLNRQALLDTKYVYFDGTFLAKEIESVVQDENILDPEYSVNSDIIFDYLHGVLDSFGIKLLSHNALSEEICNQILEDRYNILDSEELSGPIAETDTLFEDMELGIKGATFSNKFTVTLSGHASGVHRRETAIRGQRLEVSIVATCLPTIGRFGLSEYSMFVKGTPEYSTDELS